MKPHHPAHHLLLGLALLALCTFSLSARPHVLGSEEVVDGRVYTDRGTFDSLDWTYPFIGGPWLIGGL